MKNLSILLSVMVFGLISCHKDESITETLPTWLENRIQYDEDYIGQNPKSMLAYGVWVRTEWNGTIYFEYANGLSSSMYSPISFNGDTLQFYIANSSTDYFNQKCCSEVVWYGNRIDEGYLNVFHSN